LAKDIYHKDETNFEAKFFLAAAYGFKGRLHAERRHYTRASFAARNALEYLKKGRTPNELSPEFLFGDALYNYYSIWVPENFKFLKPIVSMFPKGNKELGLQQLDRVTRYAFYTRTEAQYFLMRIYANEEGSPAKAFPMAEYLNKTFPDNAYFERNYARMCYQLGKLVETEKTSLSILDKINRKMPGYEATSGRYAAFYLGYMYLYNYNEKVKAKEYLKMAVEFAKQTKSEESGYSVFATLYLLRIAKEEGKKDEAIAYAEQVTEFAEKKHEAYKEANEYLKQNKKKKFLFW
jgi:tetratricopeptide (TPR) repeat protein